MYISWIKGFKRGGGVDLDLHGERAKSLWLYWVTSCEFCLKQLKAFSFCLLFLAPFQYIGERNQRERERERMALEAVVFQQDPFSFGCRDVYAMGGGWSYGFGFEEDKVYTQTQTQTLDANVDHQQALHGNWESSCSSMVQHLKEWDANSSSTEACTGDGFLAGVPPPPQEPAATSGRRKRRRTRSVKNKEQVENQRMTHIAVERNRRRQMNEHLAVLRSLMPASYVQRVSSSLLSLSFLCDLCQIIIDAIIISFCLFNNWVLCLPHCNQGDQASIIGGAINFVKELEQLLQPLEAQKLMKQRSQTDSSTVFSNFFTFPQYSTYSTHYNSSAATKESMAEKRSAIADVEVTMVETHANIRVLSRTRPKQLFKMVAWLHSVRLTILHLNVTTVDHMVLYSFSAKVRYKHVYISISLSLISSLWSSLNDPSLIWNFVFVLRQVEDDCVLSSVNEIATAVYETVGRIQGEAPLTWTKP